MLNLEQGDVVVSAVSHVGYLVIVTKFGVIYRVDNVANSGLVTVIRL